VWRRRFEAVTPIGYLGQHGAPICDEGSVVKKVLVVLSDDWELRGDGSGEVTEIQLKPAIRLMDLYEEFGIRSTFFVETNQQLAFNRFAASYREIGRAAEIWKQSICIMRERGFDIQLHIHPQWYGALYDGKSWRLNCRKNIGDYPREIVQALVADGIIHVDSFLRGGFRPISFRAGKYGALPTRNLFETLAHWGVRFDSSVVNNLFLDGDDIRLDYRNIESPHFPYYPDYDDVRRISQHEAEIVEIPIQTFKVSLLAKLRQRLRKFAVMARNRLKKMHMESAENQGLAALGPSADTRDNDGNRRRHSEAIFDLSNLDLYLMKYGIAKVLARALAQEQAKVVPIVLTNHTKDLGDQKVAEIRSFLDYMIRTYADSVQFMTMAQLCEQRHLMSPLMKKEQRAG
jgi:hypothetical protein